MKVAVCHDFLLSKGGAERVALILAKNLKADIWTALYDPNATYDEFRNINTYELKVLSKSTPFLQTDALFRFRNLSLECYDIIISSGNWAKQVAIRSENHPLIHYEHSPVRVFYDAYNQVKSRLGFPKRQLLTVWCYCMKPLDLEATKKIDLLIANSKTTQTRIKRFYKREASVIYPPVDIKKYNYKKGSDYFISVQRIKPEKRIEMQLEIFRKLPDEKLLIVGKIDDHDSYFEKLRERAPKNVEFLDMVSEQELRELYANSKAVIQTSLREDFGLVPIEAMASGKPCIAVDEGGFRETIVNNKTGFLVRPPYIANFVRIIQKERYASIKPGDCLKQARKFSQETFIKKIKDEIARILG